MKKITLMVLLFFSFTFFVKAENVTYSDGRKYSGEVLFQNIGAFYVNRGVLDVSGVDIPEGTTFFIPVTKESFSYLGEWKHGVDIVVPSRQVSTKDFFLFNVEVDFEGNKYDVFFHHSITTESSQSPLLIPYLDSKKPGKMILRDQDNFAVVDFEIPENPKKVVVIHDIPAIPKIRAHFHLNVFNATVKMQKPNMVLKNTTIEVIDSVSEFNDVFEVSRELFSPKYYQNVVYDYNLDNQEVKYNLSNLSSRKDVLIHNFGDVNVFVSSSFRLSNLESKLSEKQKLSQELDIAVKKTQQGGEGTLYYGVWLFIICCMLLCIWFFEKQIRNLLVKTSNYKDQVVIKRLKQEFEGIIEHTKDDRFIDVIFKLQRRPPYKVNKEDIEDVLTNLKNISSRLKNNIKLKEELIQKKHTFVSYLQQAKNLLQNNQLEVRLSTVSFADTIESCELAISQLDEKLSTIESLNQQYREKVQDFCKYLTKYLLDSELNNVTQSVKCETVLDTRMFLSIERDLYNLEKLQEKLDSVRAYEEALTEVISPREHVKVSNLVQKKEG